MFRTLKAAFLFPVLALGLLAAPAAQAVHRRTHHAVVGLRAAAGMRRRLERDAVIPVAQRKLDLPCGDR